MVALTNPGGGCITMYLSFIASRQFGYVNASSKLLATSFHFLGF